MTRSYWWRWPLYRSRREPGPDWRLFRLLDFVPLIVVLIFGGAVLEWLAIGWYIVVLPFVVAHRRRPKPPVASDDVPQSHYSDRR